MLPPRPWLQNLLQAQGLGDQLLNSRRSVNAAPFTIVAALHVAPGTWEDGPLTQWSPQARVLTDYLHHPGDAYSIRITALFRTSDAPAVRLRLSRRGAEGYSECTLKYPLFRPGWAKLEEIGRVVIAGATVQNGEDALRQLGHIGATSSSNSHALRRRGSDQPKLFRFNLKYGLM